MLPSIVRPVARIRCIMSDSEIKTCDELKNKVADVDIEERGKQRELIGRAIELGCIEHIPDEWGVDIDEHH